MNAIIKPVTSLNIDTELSGDKSISHRAAMISALAEGTSTIANFSSSADCRSTLDGLEKLGVTIHRSNNNGISIKGNGRFGFTAPETTLDCGNSGTTARLLAGILAGQLFDSVITGDESLLKRPMKRIADPLTRMGSQIELADGQTLPAKIHGKPLHGIEYIVPVPSAQVKSSLVLAGLLADGETSITETLLTRDHTERMIPGIRIQDSQDKRTITMSREIRIEPRHYIIPGDISSAAFLIAAGLMIQESKVILRNISINPTRTLFIKILQDAGAEINITNAKTDSAEPYADIEVKPLRGSLDSFSITPGMIPLIIDEIPILAVLGTQCSKAIEIRHVRELRYKECDRISAIVNNLRAMSLNCEEYDDGFRIQPGKLHGATIDSNHDHRIAMAFSVAALAAQLESVITHTECVSISFPEFFSLLKINNFY